MMPCSAQFAADECGVSADTSKYPLTANPAAANNAATRAVMPRIFIEPPPSVSYARCSPSFLLDPGDHVPGRALIDIKGDVIASLDCLQHRRVLDRINHGHRIRHIERLDRTVLDRHLRGGAVDLLDFAGRGCAIGQSRAGAHEQRKTKGGGEK